MVSRASADMGACYQVVDQFRGLLQYVQRAGVTVRVYVRLLYVHQPWGRNPANQPSRWAMESGATGRGRLGKVNSIPSPSLFVVAVQSIPRVSISGSDRVFCSNLTLFEATVYCFVPIWRPGLVLLVEWKVWKSGKQNDPKSSRRGGNMNTTCLSQQHHPFQYCSSSL